MTKSNKINILRADHVVGLSQASIEINIGVKILLLGGRTLPSLIPTPIGNPKFQKFSNSNSDCRFGICRKNCQLKVFSFFWYSNQKVVKSAANIAKHTFPFNFFVKSLNLPSLKIFSVDFENDPKGILKKEKHFQQTVFHADFKSAVKILIWAIWNF